MKKQLGFTLIELMVVMAIVAILATARLSAYTNYLKGARDTTRIAKARQLQTIIESLSSVSGPPTPVELNTYLTSEGISLHTTPEKSLLVSTSETITSILGIPNSLALINDPTGGKSVCLDHNKKATIVCQFTYYRFSDNTYAVSYGVEEGSNLVNPHYSNLITPRTYGSFVGNSKAITLTPTTAITNIEEEIGLVSLGISSAVGATISDLNGNTANGGGSECSAVGEVCSDGTIYVNASLRTTISNEGNMSMGAGISACSAKGTGWHLPTATELNLLCVNAASIGNFPLSGSDMYWSSTGDASGGCYSAGHVTGNTCNATNMTRGSCWSGPIRCVKTL